jgi:hypothetical protein
MRKNIAVLGKKMINVRLSQNVKEELFLYAEGRSPLEILILPMQVV